MYFPIIKFANHSNNWCPGDPAAFWAYGTGIDMAIPSSLTQWDQNGNSYSRGHFTLQDFGDTSCSQGNYWVDVYFGRWKPSADPCVCDNVSGTCDLGAHNNCTDAVNWGTGPVTYFGP